MHDAMVLSCVETESLGRPERVHDYLRQQFPGHGVSERERFVFRREFADLISEDHKRTTIRYTKDTVEYPARAVLPIFVVQGEGASEEHLFFKGCVEISVVCYKKYESLSDVDARLDGFNTLADLKRTLSQIYGPIGKDEIVTIFGIKAQQA